MIETCLSVAAATTVLSPAAISLWRQGRAARHMWRQAHAPRSLFIPMREFGSVTIGTHPTFAALEREVRNRSIEVELESQSPLMGLQEWADGEENPILDPRDCFDVSAKEEEVDLFLVSTAHFPWNMKVPGRNAEFQDRCAKIAEVNGVEQPTAEVALQIALDTPRWRKGWGWCSRRVFFMAMKPCQDSIIYVGKRYGQRRYVRSINMMALLWGMMGSREEDFVFMRRRK